MKKLSCSIPVQVQQSEILIQAGLLESSILIDLLKPLAHRFIIITDDHVNQSAGQQLFSRLEKAGLNIDLLVFPSGEQHKTRVTKEMLENQMLEARCGRDTCVIALGGGVATDLGGFVAATYNRGIPLVMIPTSLLAMVDASIGGKNGVDVPSGKNLIGTFYQPRYVLIDPNALKTLPERELRNGVVEMIKHALIADRAYFDFFESQVQEFLALEPTTMERAIYESCVIKKTIVEEDEKETGKRRLLNCGHTLAHAIELLSDFNISHGEAVAIGIVIEGYISHQQGHLSQKELNSILKVFQSYGVPLKKLEGITPSQIMDATVLDKKSLKGKPRYVLLEGIGNPLSFEGSYCAPVEEALLIQALNWYSEGLGK